MKEFPTNGATPRFPLWALVAAFISRYKAGSTPFFFNFAISFSESAEVSKLLAFQRSTAACVVTLPAELCPFTDVTVELEPVDLEPEESAVEVEREVSVLGRCWRDGGVALGCSKETCFLFGCGDAAGLGSIAGVGCCLEGSGV